MEYILGIDASLSSTGWAVLDKATKDVIECGKICTTNVHDEDDRIAKITFGLIRKCVEYDIHDAPMENGFVGGNMKTALQLAKLRGGIAIGIRMYKVRCSYKQPPEIKKIITGKGNASKEEVAEKIIDLYKDNKLVQALGPFNDRSCKAKNSDIYDAISIAYASLEEKEGQLVS